jgi:hypothetical protein
MAPLPACGGDGAATGISPPSGSGLTLLCSGYSANARVLADGYGRLTLGEAVRRAHPSVVLAIEAAPRALPSQIEGYTPPALRAARPGAPAVPGSSLLFWQVVLAPEPHPRAASPIVRMLLVLAAMSRWPSSASGC